MLSILLLASLLTIRGQRGLTTNFAPRFPIPESVFIRIQKTSDIIIRPIRSFTTLKVSCFLFLIRTTYPPIGELPMPLKYIKKNHLMSTRAEFDGSPKLVNWPNATGFPNLINLTIGAIPNGECFSTRPARWGADISRKYGDIRIVWLEETGILFLKATSTGQKFITIRCVWWHIVGSIPIRLQKMRRPVWNPTLGLK